MGEVSTLIRAEGVTALLLERQSLEKEIVEISKEIARETEAHLLRLNELNRRQLAAVVKTEALDESLIRLMHPWIDETV